MAPLGCVNCREYRSDCRPPENTLCSSSGFGLGEALRDRAPVHDVPPGIDIIGAFVLVLQIIGVFPDVDTDDRYLAVHVRTILVGGAENLKLAIGQDQPGPAAAK